MLERSAVRSNAASPAGEDGSSIAWLDEGVERSRPIHKARSSSSWRTVDWRNCGIAKVPLGNSCKHKQPSQRIHYWSQVATDCVCVLTGSGSRRIRCKTAWTSSAVGTALKTQPRCQEFVRQGVTVALSVKLRWGTLRWGRSWSHVGAAVLMSYGAGGGDGGNGGSARYSA